METKANPGGRRVPLTRGAQSVDRAVGVLECFTADRPSLTLAEIAQQVELTPPTAHRLLQALRAHDLVIYDEHRRQYTLGSGIMRIAGVVLNQDLLAAARLWLGDLRDATDETVALHWRVKETRVCLLELVSDLPVHMASGVGNSYPLTAGAAGKAMLAFTEPDEADRLIDQSGLGRLERASLRAALPEIRARGYARSDGETVSGGAALASPLLDAEGRAVAALNVTGPRIRVNAIDERALGIRLGRTAERIGDEIAREGAGAIR
ncbi:MAG TPA: IclR family transcriptional regulator [Solirubrobacterales bacterium]|nr:IclR family transcriptional regulator [Solirubrobacterales bacterium]